MPDDLPFCSVPICGGISATQVHLSHGGIPETGWTISWAWTGQGLAASGTFEPGQEADVELPDGGGISLMVTCTAPDYQSAATSVNC
jgi:hypothetical protein